jgi:hypothetical protein
MEGGERWLGFPLSTLAPLFSFFYFTRHPFILFSRFVSAVLGVGTPYALRVLLEPSGVGHTGGEAKRRAPLLSHRCA